MDHFLKSFSVIDFLGIFAPGALVTLACNAYFGGMTEPFMKFFDDQSITLVIYFIFLSYLVGILLQEISKPLENIFCSEEACHAYWQKNSKIQTLYEKIFKQPIHVTQTQAQAQTGDKNRNGRENGKKGDLPDYTAWDNIYRYVQPDIKEMKIPLFHAFASMARSSCVAALVIMLMNWCAYIRNLETATNIGFTTFFCVSIFGLMLWRYQRFYGRMVSYCYTAFLQLDDKKIDKNQKAEDEKQG